MPALNKKLFHFGGETFRYKFEDKNFLKAVINGIALSVSYLIELVQEELFGLKNTENTSKGIENSSKSIKKLYVGGALTKLEYLPKIQASLAQIKIIKSTHFHTTSLGLAFLMGLYRKIWDEQKIKNLIIESELFLPEMSPEKARKLRDIFRKSLDEKQ